MNQLNKIKFEVPSWNENYFHDVEFAPPQIRKFYQFLVEEISKGNFVNIDGETYYIQLYLRSVVEHFIIDKNINKLLEKFEAIRQAYGTFLEIKYLLRSFTADAYLYLSDFDKAWFYIRQRRICIEDVINFRSKCKETFIDAEDLFSALGGYKKVLTKFGQNNLESITEIVSSSLNSFYKTHGKNIIEYFCQQFVFDDLKDKDFCKLRELIDNEENFIFLKRTYEAKERNQFIENEIFPHRLQRNIFGGVSLCHYINYEGIPLIILKAIENQNKQIDLLRNKSGI